MSFLRAFVSASRSWTIVAPAVLGLGIAHPSLKLGGTVHPTAQDVYVLTRRDSVGEKTAYALKMSFEQRGVSITIESKSEVKVVSIGDGKIVTENVTSGVKARVGDAVHEVDDTTTTKLTQSLNGEIVAIDRTRRKDGDLRLATMMQVVVPSEPVRIGQKWEHLAKAKQDPRTFDAKFQFTAESVERIGSELAVRVSLSAMETSGDKPISVAGKVWLSTANGRTLKSDLKVTNAPIGEGLPLTMTLQQTILPAR